MASPGDIPPSLEADFVALRKLRDDDAWNNDTAERRLVAIKDPAAWDLASKLLVRDPDERAKFSIADTLAKHPFFNPESGEAVVKKQLDVIQTRLGEIKDVTPMPPIAQGQDIARDSLANTLARSNVSTSGTCNNMTCYCAIA